MTNEEMVAENARLREELEDWQATHNRVINEPCREDEKHCTCVPALRHEIERLQKENALLRNVAATGRDLIAALQAALERR